MAGLLFRRISGGTGCPVCTGRKILAAKNNLASQFPKIAAQWHPSKNGALLPQQVAPTSKPPRLVAMRAGTRLYQGSGFRPHDAMKRDVPIAQESGCLRDSMIWRRCCQSWPASGNLL